MQGKDHNLILGIAFLVEFIVYGLVTLLFLLLFVFQVVLMLMNNPDLVSSLVAGGIYLVLVSFMLLISLSLGMASWKMLKNRNNARVWGIISAIVSLPMMIPFGFILGIYGLWFFFSDLGKHYYFMQHQS